MKEIISTGFVKGFVYSLKTRVFVLTVRLFKFSWKIR